jgi:anti-anti-sigma regulatory factor
MISVRGTGLPRVATPGERPGTELVLVVTAPITRADIPGLCARLRGLLDASDAERVLCDMTEFATPDAVAIDALGRLQLAVRRRGKSIELTNASPELRALLALVGLEDVFVYLD